MSMLRKKEKPTEEKGKTGKKTGIVLSAAGAVIIAAGAAVFLSIRFKSGEGQMNMPPAMNQLGEGVITASALTSVGMLDETWELDFLQTALYVEESYLSTGDEVEEGTAVFKVSDQTLEEARKELEDAVTEAELVYRQGIIDYETGVIDARVTNESAAVNKKYSQAEYDYAADAAAQNVRELEKQIEEARELVEEYTKSVNEDYYRTYYKVDELYQTYYEHFSLLMETYEKWEIEDKESLYGNNVPSLGGASGNGSVGGSSGSGSAGSSVGNSSGSSSQGAKRSGGTSFTIPTSASGSLYSTMNLVMTGGGKRDTYSRSSMLNSGRTYELIRTTTGSGDGDDNTGSNGENGNQPQIPDGSGEGSPPERPEDTGQDKGEIPAEGFGQEGGMPGGSIEGGYSENETLLSVYNLLDELVKQEAEEYETALENYETARRTAQAGLEKAQSDLASLEAQLVTARTEYEKQLITCQSDYEITLAESDNAQAVYEVTLESLKETLTSLENKKEEAVENLALFEEVIGDGYFYTRSAGTIVGSGVRKGSYLSGESLIIAYSNPGKVTVSASVDQSDIAEIAIGDSVYVMISEYGNYQGKVTMINPVTQARSKSSVTYQVTVTLEGDVSALDSNLTAYVYFGMSDEMMRNMPEMQSMPEGEGGNPEREGGGVPKGGNMPWDGDNGFPGNGRKEGRQ